MAHPNALDLWPERKIEAVVIPYGDGFLAAGIQIASWGYGEEIDDALEALTYQCAEIDDTCAEALDTDLAFVYGRSNPSYLHLALVPIEEREQIEELIGHG